MSKVPAPSGSNGVFRTVQVGAVAGRPPIAVLGHQGSLLDVRTSRSSASQASLTLHTRGRGNRWRAKLVSRGQVR
jgi:hypothetical protein